VTAKEAWAQPKKKAKFGVVTQNHKRKKIRGKNDFYLTKSRVDEEKTEKRHFNSTQTLIRGP